jgi:15-cis-phytoene synthase
MTIAAIEAEYAYGQCERITRASAANFYYGIRLLPRVKRRAMCAVYAFARRVDDIGDGDPGVGAVGVGMGAGSEGAADERLQRLARERGRLAALAEDQVNLDDPVGVALAHASAHYRLPPDALDLLIEGVERDVRGAKYETFDELVRYCRCVAGSIGRLCLAIFSDGSATPQAHRLADDLGVAMQLTNILRDVVEDRGLGRVYLPAEDLRRFDSPDVAVDSLQTIALIRFEAERAEDWFDRGLRLLDLLDGRSAACVEAMTGIYRRLLERILEDPAVVTRGRISLSPLEKSWVATRSLVTAAAAERGR